MTEPADVLGARERLTRVEAGEHPFDVYGLEWPGCPTIQADRSIILADRERLARELAEAREACERRYQEACEEGKERLAWKGRALAAIAERDALAARATATLTVIDKMIEQASLQKLTAEHNGSFTGSQTASVALQRLDAIRAALAAPPTEEPAGKEGTP